VNRAEWLWTLGLIVFWVLLLTFWTLVGGSADDAHRLVLVLIVALGYCALFFALGS